MVKHSDDKKKILESIVEIKKKGLLPTRYAKAINNRYPHLIAGRIHDVANGNYFNEEIVDAILELAAENKDKQRLAKAAELLKD